MRFNDIPVLILAKPANDILVGHLGAQTASGRLVPVDPVREDTSASAFPATQPLYETCYGRFWRYAIIGQIFIAQKHFVAAMETSHMHHKFNGLHDQSSSVSRVTAGAAGFLILTQQSPAWSIRRPEPLRHYAFAAEGAGLFVDDRAVDFEMTVKRDAGPRAAQ